MGTHDRVAEAFRGSELARALFLEAGDALLIVDPSSERVIDANPTAESLSKHGRDALLRLTVREVVRHELGWDDWLQTVQQTSTFHGRDGYLLKTVSGDGWVPVSLTISRLHLPSSPPLALLTFRDRSEQAEAYRRVQRTEAELRRVLISVTDCLYSYRLDLRGRRYRYLSPVVETLSGRPVTWFLDDPLRWGEVIDAEDHARWREFMGGLAPKMTRELEYRVRRPEGDLRWVRESVTTGPEEAGGYLVHGVLSDVTERRQAEEAAEELRRHEHQKLESLGTLAGTLAHDFNDLLTGVLGNAGLARMMLPEGSEAAAPLQQIEVGAMRAAEVCRQLRTFTGQARVVLGRVSLNDVAAEAVESLRGRVSPRATIRLEFAPQLPAVIADPVALRQLLANLIVNAAEAVEEKAGAVRVKTEAGRFDAQLARQARFAAADSAEGDAVAVEVSDDGPGMAPEVQARMFEPFFSTKFRGRGLGLATVLGTVRSHRGAVFVESAVGAGTTVRVWLPCDRTDPSREPTSPPPEPSARMVLVVDDEDAVLTVTARMLEAAGFGVITARDGREAVERYRERSRVVGLVVMDLTMPHMNGEEAFRELKRQRPDLPVVLMSGYPRPDVMGRFAGLGLAAFLQKPFRPTELLELVRRHYPARSAD